MKKHFPNAITCANLFAGCIGVVFAFQGDLKTAAYLVLLSGVFDFFDGMVARLLNVKSAIGKELDSLADMVSFGFLPGVVMFKLLQASNLYHEYLAYAAFLIPVFSALRLAKFNIDERQTSDFIGLNTPMNTLFIVSLSFIRTDFPALFQQTYPLLVLIVICCFLLVSEIRFFSLKLSDLSWKANQMKYIFLLLSLAAILFLGFKATPLILFLYLVTSLLHFRNKPAN